MYMGTLPVNLPNTKPLGVTYMSQPQTTAAYSPVSAAQPKAAEGDSFVKKNKAKFAIGLGVAALAVGVGLFAAVKTGRYDKFKGELLIKTQDRMVREADEIQTASADLFTRTRQKINEVATYIQEGMQDGFAEVVEDGGRVSRRFSGDLSELSENSIMEEFDAAGTLIRRTKFSRLYDGEIDTIEEFIGKTTNRIVDINGDDTFTVLTQAKGNKVKEAFDFYGGKLQSYMQGIKEFENGKTVKKMFSYRGDGNVNAVAKKLRYNGRNVQTAKLYGALDREAILTNADWRTNKTGAVYSYYPDGKLQSVAYDVEDKGTDVITRGRSFDYDENGKRIKWDDIDLDDLDFDEDELFDDFGDDVTGIGADDFSSDV